MPNPSSTTERSTHTSASSRETQPPFIPLTTLPAAKFDWKTFAKYVITLGITASFGLLSGAFLLYAYHDVSVQRRQAATETLERAKAFKDQGDFDRCIETAQLSSHHFASAALQRDCQEELDQRKLRQASQLAFVQGQFVAAITLAKSVSSPALQEDVRQFILRATRRMMELIEECYRAGRMEDAVHIARAIGIDNPLYAQVQSRIGQMQIEWAEQAHYYEAAQRWLEADQLDEATASLQNITHPYWQTQMQATQDAVQARRSELEGIVSQAKWALAQSDAAHAVALADTLPATEPWLGEKANIYAAAKRIEERKFFHQTLAWVVVFLLMISMVFFK